MALSLFHLGNVVVIGSEVWIWGNGRNECTGFSRCAS